MPHRRQALAALGRKPMKKLKLGLILTIACSVLVSLAGCGQQTAHSEVQTVEVSRGNIVQSVTVDGTLSLVQDRKLTFGTAGEVAEVMAEEGDRVTEGQVLASLDIASLEHALKAAEQTAKKAEQGVKTAELTVKAAELTVKTAELAVKAAEIDLELANNNYQKLTTPYPFLTYRFALPESVDDIRIAQQRLKEAQEEFVKGLEGKEYSLANVKDWLFQAQEKLSAAEEKLAQGLGAGILPTIDYWTLREAQMQADKAQIALDKARNDLDQARNDSDQATNNVDIAKNELDRANNDLDRARDELEKAVIVAPFAGLVAKINVKEGDVLSSVNYATTVAFEVIDPNRMELKAEVDEIDIPEVKLGQKVIIQLDALPDVKFEGRVIFISPLPTVESGVVQYSVTIGFDVPAGYELKAGMSATADIVFSERNDVLLVPNRAIVPDSAGNPLVKVMVSGQIQERPVVIGISDGFQTEIVDGLNEGEVVLIEKQTKPESSGSGGFLFGE